MQPHAYFYPQAQVLVYKVEKYICIPPNVCKQTKILFLSNDENLTKTRTVDNTHASGLIIMILFDSKQ